MAHRRFIVRGGEAPWPLAELLLQHLQLFGQFPHHDHITLLVGNFP